MPIKKCISLFIVTAFLVSGCSFLGSGNKPSDTATEQGEESGERILYEEAQASLLRADYADAIDQLKRLETYFPFGRYAEQAQLELIYANFMRTDYDTAILAAERFINLHPQHQNADYAYYMKGLSNYQRDRGFFDRLLGTPEPLRDVTSARIAFSEFEELLTRFPNCRYARDAQYRMYYLRNVLAEAELNVAYFYLRRDAWVSAITRAREIVEHYPQTAVVPHALEVLVEANHKLGFDEASDDALEVLAINFPDWQGFNEDGELVIKIPIKNKDRSFLNTISFGLLDRPKSSTILTLDPPDGEAPVPPRVDES